MLAQQREAASKYLSRLIDMITTQDAPIRIYGLLKLRHLLSLTTPAEEEG